MEDQKQEIVEQIQKILSEAFSRFYREDDFKITRPNKKSNDEQSEYPNIKFLSMPEIENFLGINVCEESPSRFFASFLIKGFHQECWKKYFDLPEDDEVEKYADRIYQKALSLFEQYMHETIHINLSDIIAISACYQEGEAASGNIYFLYNNSPNLTLRFLDYIEQKNGEIAVQKELEKVTLCSKNVRKIRKALEIAREIGFIEALEPVFLYDEKWRLEGFCNGDVHEPHIRFHFTGHMIWEMYWDRHAIIRYNCGKFENPLPDYEKLLKTKIEKLPNMKNDYNYNLLKNMVHAAAEQRHGTTLIILCEKESIAREEVNRLYIESSGTLIRTRQITADIVRRLTSIDGALMLDKEGNCYGYGMILTVKGENRVKKDSGRGARFNSAKLYIAEKASENRNAIAVIVSEDGMINIYSTKDAEEEMNKADGNR